MTAALPTSDMKNLLSEGATRLDSESSMVASAGSDHRLGVIQSLQSALSANIYNKIRWNPKKDKMNKSDDWNDLITRASKVLYAQ